MYQLSNFIDNDDIRTLAQLGPFQVIEYQRDLSVSPDSAQTAYFSSVMHVRRRQVLCDLKQANITLQAGAMQWSVGNVNATTGVKGVGDLFGKALRGKVTGESAIKPEYTGDGLLVLEPTYKHILLLDLADWNGSIVLDDGLFLACGRLRAGGGLTRACSIWASLATVCSAWSQTVPGRSWWRSPSRTMSSRWTATWRWPGAAA